MNGEMSDVVSKSKWPIAYIDRKWKRELGPLVRKTYGDGEGSADPASCREIARMLRSLANAADEAATLATTEQVSR